MAQGDVVHVIHPVTYSQRIVDGKSTLVIGPPEGVGERDAQIETLLRKAMDSGGKVIYHRDKYLQDFVGGMHDLTLSFNPHLKILLAKGVSQIVTTKYGLPIPESIPEEVEGYKEYMRYYTSVSGLERLMGLNSRGIVIGGFLECCVRNFIGFILHNYKDTQVYGSVESLDTFK